MRIAKVEAIPVAYPEPNDHSRKRSVCLVKITSTDGVVGWGECCSYFPEASRAAKALVDGMAELVVGESVLATHRIWHAIRHHAWWYGNGAGIASAAFRLALTSASTRSARALSLFATNACKDGPTSLEPSERTNSPRHTLRIPRALATM